MSTIDALATGFSLDLIGSTQEEISSVAISSHHIRPGGLFIAVQGAKSHGLDHLQDAVDRGAVAVLSDRASNTELPQLIHPNPRQIAGELSAMVYGTAGLGLKVFGVTGTNGKTSTSIFLYRLLEQMGVPSGLSSSAMSLVAGKAVTGDLTTPEAPRLHWLMREMSNHGARAVVIEVSAQALVRNRVDGVVFDVSGFTNLSRDHLDDFDSMQSYLQAKSRLFSSNLSRHCVINCEDAFGQQMLDAVQSPAVGIGEGLDYQVKENNGNLKIAGKNHLDTKTDVGPLMSKNLGLAIVMLLEAGFEAERIAAAVESADLTVPGRLQRVTNSAPAVFIDYAHTPAAVAAACEEVSRIYPRFTLVLSASGDRDAGKRVEMGLAGGKLAANVVVTDQHPRSEDPALIRGAVLSGLLQQLPPERVFEVADPGDAIAKALDLAQSGEAILWCGPGHLKYREVKGEKIPFDAIEVTKAALKI
ncbi:MAG: UDP-N-acetylmuramoyl-L-alanyl-D-glutamate--2,6-diaminopimelate ligase [Aquiluna sp.]|nr:UDP-N-acetylmuramoyl-L-alanyl-D-glutamate--2,6-diaminopimelate ligase [Aquiluna sp.]